MEDIRYVHLFSPKPCFCIKLHLSFNLLFLWESFQQMQSLNRNTQIAHANLFCLDKIMKQVFLKRAFHLILRGI